MTTVDWKAVATSLLGSWPSQVASWGPEGIAAFIAEVQARGVTPEGALTAIRSCGPDQKFPPSAPELAGLARRSEAPRILWAEAYQLLYGRGGVFRARPKYNGGWRDNELQVATDKLQLERAEELSPLLGAFVRSTGLRRLRTIELDDPEYGALRLKELEAEWDRFCEVNEDRDIAQIVAPRRGSMGRVDPLAALGLGRREIEAGDPS